MPAANRAPIGIATCPCDAASYDMLFEIADKRLYQAKGGGRNRVVGERPPAPEKPVRLIAG